MQKQFKAVVHGMVQGVSFRYYTRREANKLNIVGWVANQPDGTVHVVAQGDAAQLEQFLAFLHEGSPAAHVTRVDVGWQSPTEPYTTFNVRYTSR